MRTKDWSLSLESSSSFNHHCRSGEHCVARGSDGEAALTTKPHTICTSCLGQLQHQYDELPAIRDALRLYIGEMSTSNHGSKVKSTPSMTTPLNVAVLDLIDDIEDVLADCGNYRIDNLIHQPSKESKVWRSGRQREELLDGVDRALQIRVVFKRADKVIGFSREAVTHRIHPCPKCTRQTMVSVAGTNTVNCISCGATTTMDEYKRIVLIRVSLQKKGIN